MKRERCSFCGKLECGGAHCGMCAHSLAFHGPIGCVEFDGEFCRCGVKALTSVIDRD